MVHEHKRQDLHPVTQEVIIIHQLHPRLYRCHNNIFLMAHPKHGRIIHLPHQHKPHHLHIISKQRLHQHHIIFRRILTHLIISLLTLGPIIEAKTQNLHLMFHQLWYYCLSIQ